MLAALATGIQEVLELNLISRNLDRLNRGAYGMSATTTPKLKTKPKTKTIQTQYQDVLWFIT